MCPLHSLKSSDIYNVEILDAQTLSDLQSGLKEQYISWRLAVLIAPGIVFTGLEQLKNPPVIIELKNELALVWKAEEFLLTLDAHYEELAVECSVIRREGVCSHWKEIG